MRISRNSSVTRIAVVAALGLAMTAFGGADVGHAGDPPASASADSSGDETTGGRLVVGNADEPTLGFYPPTSAVSIGGNTIAMGIFDTLTVVDNDGNFLPYLADSIEPNEDNTVWTIVVRPGIEFSDGTVLDAAALKDNFDRLAEAGRPIEIGYESSVVDDMTLEVSFPNPYGAFPAAMSSPYAWIASPTAMADMTEEEFDENPVGTGPYLIKEWVRDDHLTLERNPTYWRADEGLPYYDEIEFRPIIEDAARLAALEAGDVDVITVGASDVADMLERTDEFNVYPVSQGVDAILFNNTIAPFDDVRVRTALSLALDAEGLIIGAWDGVGTVATGPIPNDNPFATAADYPTYDPDTARALIDEYEAETGTEVAFTLSFGQSTVSAEVAQLAQQYWGDIGVDVELEGPITASDYPGKVVTLEYEAAVYGIPGFVDPDVWLWIEFKSDGFLNLTGMNVPGVDEALNIAHGSSDREERIAAYADMQAILAEQLPMFFVRDEVDVVASNLGVVGVDEFPLLDGTMGSTKEGQFYLPFAPEALHPA
jgi:ABC-type transport system substrate-binding protein